MLEAKRRTPGECWVEFSPSVAKRATVVGGEINGRPLPFHLDKHIDDAHVSIRFPVEDTSATVTIRMKHDFGLSLTNELPALGSKSRGLRVVDASWDPVQPVLILEVSGLASHQYELSIRNPAEIESVKGAVLTKSGKLQIQIPSGPDDSYMQHKVFIQLVHP